MATLNLTASDDPETKGSPKLSRSINEDQAPITEEISEDERPIVSFLQIFFLLRYLFRQQNWFCRINAYSNSWNQLDFFSSQSCHGCCIMLISSQTFYLPITCIWIVISFIALPVYQSWLFLTSLQLSTSSMSLIELGLMLWDILGNMSKSYLHATNLPKGITLFVY